jgi:hypothetical protein
MIIIYFSGHTIVGKDGVGRLIVYDSSIDKQASTIGLDELKRLLTDIKSLHKLVFLDAKMCSTAPFNR